jgi:uncharacterized protein YgbK (DUF1537 family)
MSLLLAYYGDDFTGSTDVLEALSTAGIETVLFTRPPSDEMLRHYPGLQAVGVAGHSRAMSPDEMELELPGIFAPLAQLQPQFVHYKTCSTFDSSSTIGSIGRAIEIAQREFQNRIVPLVVGAPSLQRFCVFGNLFARSGLDSEIYRLDRHPTMRNHPVTPMDESDLRLYLARQTDWPMFLIDCLQLDRGSGAVAAQLTETNTANSIVLFDVLTEVHLATIGCVISELQEYENKPLFVAGSSGIEYALVKHWQSTGMIRERRSIGVPAPTDRTIAVCGSCSPVTRRQIAWAIEHGYAEVPLDAKRMVASKDFSVEIVEIVKQTRAELAAGRSVIVHTQGSRVASRGQVSPKLASESRRDSATWGTTDRLGVILGQILREVLHQCRLPRVAVVGGDTAGQVARELGIDALQMAGTLAPGSPLCRVSSADPAIDGIEITFKGGQVGHDDFFGSLLSGQYEH